MTLTVQLMMIKYKKPQETNSSLVDYRTLKRKKTLYCPYKYCYLPYEAVWQFPKQSKCICDFLKCKQIFETHITTGEIINVLSACYHLLSKNKSVCLALYCNQHSSDVVSVTAAFDKQVDNCDNVTRANEIFNKMSAE